MNIRPGAVVFSLLLLTGIAGVAWFRGLAVDDEAESKVAIAVDARGAVPARVDGGSAAVPVSPEPKVEAIGEIASVRDWMRSYHESADDFLLARELAGAALLGDARAEYLLGQVLLRCEVYKRMLAPYTVGTVSERIEAHVAASSGTLERSRMAFRRGAQRCDGIFSDDPFAEYDLPEEARDFRYWSKRAVESGDPLAVMERAGRLAVGRNGTDDAEQAQAFREALLGDVRIAVSSGDPAALFTVGGLFSHPSVVADPKQGAAWLVAACEMGYDCSNANPSWASGCIEDGTCAAGETRLTEMQRDFGAAKYAEIYAKAQDIQYKIRAGDWDGLQQYLEVK